MDTIVLAPPIERRSVRVRGTVQGVGFRPFVWRLANELALDGWVLNDAEGVLAEVQGSPRAVDDFLRRLAAEAPPLATVGAIEHETLPVQAVRGFAIVASRGGAATTPVTPDAATCPDCLAELFDPADRRFRYPFINCTHCGPRFTITRGVPYDRPRTTMSSFAMCPACQREYVDPSDRRFHAQPDACPACGPSIALLGEDGARRQEGDVVAAALARIRAGKVVAVKGLGGFHLVCDARNVRAVARLRASKHREEKPFAVMAANVASFLPYARVDEASRRLLESRERPIVLLEKRPGCDEALAGIANGVSALGAMLPVTPLQWLLFFAASGAAGGTAWIEEPQDLVLVMTSANPGGEPLVLGNDEAVRRLAGIADAFVVHDRDIAVRCDDSLVRATVEGPAFVRRARGYTPRAIRLPRAGPTILATGAWLKNTVCVTRGDEAFLSPHIGDLDNGPTCEALDEAVAHLLAILEVEPAACAHDLHPDFYSTRFAAQFASGHGIPAFAIQHHHAHIAAVCAEHGHSAPAIGLALDGVGLGTDGTAWGGELLRVEGAHFARLGHLGELRLPGGDRAAREPWRVAASVLHTLGRGAEIAQRFPRAGAAIVTEMLERGTNSPVTTSAGRWFDAAAALLGVREVTAFEGQAAMQLEALATGHGPVEPDRSRWRIGADGTLDLLPLAERLAGTQDAAFGAALFHATLIEALAEWVLIAAAREGLATVALGGGCFVNAILSTGLRRQLASGGLTVLEARQAPANDGGIALGQAWVAMQEFN
ncbi:MAG TPA: carbamoyltransferase HypF [Usitatibacteraceae bacterium]|nr:carbamoyltransferase HypF [Usitatibacteraceae bacterium]